MLAAFKKQYWVFFALCVVMPFAISRLPRQKGPRPPVFEKIVDPRLLFSEVDDTLAVPWPSGLPPKTNFWVLKGLSSCRPFCRVINGNWEKLQPANAYYGRGPGKQMDYAYVYMPPSPVSEWTIELRAEYVYQLGIGPYHVTIRTNIYVWKTPKFERMDPNGFKKANISVRPGTEIFMRHTGVDFAAIGTVSQVDQNHPFSDGHAGPAAQIRFVSGDVDWLPGNALTNYFISSD